MVGTIGYLGKVHLRLGLECWFRFTLGATLAASLYGATLGLLGMGLRAGLRQLGAPVDLVIGIPLALWMVVCAVYEFGSPRLRVPGRRRQLERSQWLELGRKRTSFIWGALMGVGFRTPIVFALYFGMIALALASGSPLTGALIVGSYGLTQGVSLMVFILGLRWKGDGIADVLQSPGATRLSHWINGTAALFFAGYLLVTLLSAARPIS
jgi:sulfite exporter TauE/SafE